MSKFNMSRLQYVRQLTAISPSMRFHSSNDKIICSQKNENIGFIMKFPKSDFPFEGDIASFIDYKEFIGILNMLSPDAVMTQKSRYITFNDTENNIKIDYTLTSNTIDLSCGPIKFDFGASDATIELAAAELQKIKKFINAISAEKVNIITDSTSCTMKFFRDAKGDSAQIRFACTATSDMNFIISADFFTLSPEGVVILDIKEAGMLRLKYQNLGEATSLEVITGVDVDSE